MKVLIDDIYIGERRRREIGKLEDLMDSLRENKQITPITVRPPTEEEIEFGVKEPWVLVAGGRRLAAAIQLGWSEIEAFGREQMSELKHRLLELHENLDRKEMTWAEIAEAKAEILALKRIEDPTLTQHEVARELGENPGTFSRDIKAAEALAENPELKKASSRKAAMRAVEMERHFTKLDTREVMDQQKSIGMQRIESDVRTEDARDFLLKVHPRSVDLILTDPPYGIDYWSSGQKTRRGGSEGSLGLSVYNDDLAATMDMLTDIVPLWVRALRETGWFASFISQDLYGFLEQLFKDCCAEHCDYRHHELKGRCIVSVEDDLPGQCRFLRPEEKRWIWYRPNSRNRPRFPERHAQNFFEDILIVNAGFGRLMKPGCSNVLTFDAEYGEERIHANQKPLDLGRELISRFTRVGDIVMDTSFGSGVFLAGASSMGRHPTGCDTNPEMRKPALGYIAKYYIAAPKNVAAIEDEKRRQIEKGADEVYNFEEVEVAAD